MTPVPLDATVKSEVSKNIETYEGRIPHLYLDTVGKVTVGIGHMVPSKVAMVTIPMYKPSAQNALKLATFQEKQNEYDAIKKQPFGRNYGASFYTNHATLVMKDIDINAQSESHIQSFYTELTAYYAANNGFSKDFDAMPVEVQKSLFDMVFNLGITKLKNQYTKMNGHIKTENWNEAAKQSNRIGISPLRNKYVYNLFLKANKNNTTTP